MKRDLLQRAVEIIRGIPVDRFNLDFVANDNDPRDCGTVGCAIGWLGMNPEFQALGLRTGLPEGAGGCGTFWHGQFTSFARAASELFGISLGAAWELFKPIHKPTSRVDPDYGYSDKEAFLRRAAEVLK